MNRLLIATRSENKLREIVEKLRTRPDCAVLTLTEAGIPLATEEDDLEVFQTFEANALAKARYFARKAGLVTLADDSGICVDALEGAPGVRSKRLSERSDLYGRDLDASNNQRLLELMKDVPLERRTAHYTCALAMVAPAGPEATVLGDCRGLLLDEPRGEGGFGYDPLFYLPEFDATFGELPPRVKAEMSHRARALEALRTLLPSRVDDFGVLL